MRHQIEEAEHQYDLNRAAELKHGKLPELERQLSATQQAAEGDGPRLAAKRIELEVAAPARRHIAHAGFDPVYGARPLKRFLQRELETRIARLLVAGDMPEESRVEVVLDEGQLAVRR